MEKTEESKRRHAFEWHLLPHLEVFTKLPCADLFFCLVKCVLPSVKTAQDLKHIRLIFNMCGMVLQQHCHFWKNDAQGFQ